MTFFKDCSARLSEDVSTAFAELALLRPRVASQYAEPATDPNRREAMVHGIFSAGPAQEDLSGQARGGQLSGTTQFASTAAEFWIAWAQVDALTAPPAKGDTITLTSRTGSPAYAISAVHHTDLGDLTLTLVREDPPT